MILIYTFNYDGNENNYLKQFCSELDNELDIGEGIDNFDVETRWGPPNDILEELSSKYILIKIINEYECTQDDFAGTYELLSGKYLKDESYDISEKAWEENGSKCKDYLLLELLSENFEIIDENNNSIKFKDISDIKNFVKKIENDEDPIEEIFDELCIDTFMNDYELENCYDNIKVYLKMKL